MERQGTSRKEGGVTERAHHPPPLTLLSQQRFDEIAKAETSKPHRRFEPVLESWPQSLHQKPMSLKEFVELLREKIIGRTRRTMAGGAS